MSKTTRQTKTPKQRAEEALAVANRKVAVLDRKVDEHRIALAGLEREHATAARRDYLAQDPALVVAVETEVGRDV